MTNQKDQLFNLNQWSSVNAPNNEIPLSKHLSHHLINNKVVSYLKIVDEMLEGHTYIAC